MSTNSFNIQQVRPWDKPQLYNSITAKLSALPLGFPIGLTSLDIDRFANIRINAFADSTTQDSVKIHLDAWADTILYSASCIWLEVFANDRDFQFGSYGFSTADGDDPQTAASHQIQFPKHYAATPQVLVWLSGFDIDKSHNCRIKAFASDITPTGFIIHIDTWSDTILHSAKATWIAFPSNRQNIASGSYNTMDVRPWNEPQQMNQGKINFDKQFQSTPRVLTALNMLDVANNANMRIKLGVERVSSKRMTWNIDTWSNTVLYAAGASYLAIQDF